MRDALLKNFVVKLSLNRYLNLCEITFVSNINKYKYFDIIIAESAHLYACLFFIFSE